MSEIASPKSRYRSRYLLQEWKALICIDRYEGQGTVVVPPYCHHGTVTEDSYTGIFAGSWLARPVVTLWLVTATETIT